MLKLYYRQELRSLQANAVVALAAVRRALPAFLFLLLFPSMSFAVDLAITTLDDTPSNSDPTSAGGIITYDVTVENTTVGIASNVHLLLDLPAGSTLSAAVGPAGCAADNMVPTRVVCAIADLTGTQETPPGSSVSFQIKVSTLGLPAGTVAIQAALGVGALPDANTSLATLPVTDPFFASEANTSNNKLAQQTTLTSASNLRISKSATPNPVVGGAAIRYQVTVTNEGPTAATNLVVTDTLPTDVRYVAGSFQHAGGSMVLGTTPAGAGGSFQVTAANLAVNDSAVFTFDAKTLVGIGTLTNSVTVSSALPDPVPNDNTATVDTTVTPGADLSIGKTVSKTNTYAGDELRYTLTPRNLGPSTADTVTVSDTLPSGFTLLETPAGTAANSSWSCSGAAGDTAFSCSRPSLLTTDADNIQFKVLVGGNTGNITNTAHISSVTNDPDNSNNSGSVAVTVQPDGADLRLTKSKTPVAVVAGGEMTSTIQVVNNGPRPVTANLQVVDSLNAGESFLRDESASWDCVASNATTISCDYTGSYPVGVGAALSNLVIITRADIGSADNSLLSNNACTGGSGGSAAPVTGSGADANNSNDCNTASSRVTAVVTDLTISKTVSTAVGGDAVLAADENQLSYRLVASNNGNATSGVVVRDRIPGFIAGKTQIIVTPDPGSVFATAPGSCVVRTDGEVYCEARGNVLADGASAGVNIEVQRALLDSVGGAAACSGTEAGLQHWFCNTAYVSIDLGNNIDSAVENNSGNNSASRAIQIDRNSNITTTSKAISSGNPARAGVNTTYVINYRNNGPSKAPNVVFRDTFTLTANDPGFVLISASRTDVLGSSQSCLSQVDVAGDILVDATAPGGTSYAAGPGGGTVAVVCPAVAEMANGQAESLTLVVRPNIPGTLGRSISNTANFTVNGGTASGTDAAASFNYNSDNSAADDNKTATLLIDADEADVLVNISDPGFDPIGYNQAKPEQNQIVYLLRTTSNGPSVATAVKSTVTFSPPAGKKVKFNGVSLTSAGVFNQSNCTPTPANGEVTGPAALTLVCDMPGAGFANTGVIAANQSSNLYLALEYQTAPGATGDSIQVQADVSSATADTNSANNSENESTTVRARTDLSVSKYATLSQPAADPAVVLADVTTTVTLKQPFFYVVEGENFGPGASLSRDRTGDSPNKGTGTVIRDTLPAGLVVTGPVSWQKIGDTDGGALPSAVGSGTCAQSGQSLTCQLGDLNVNGKVRVIVPARWDNWPGAGNVLTTSTRNTASISTEQLDPVPGNNSTALDTNVTRAEIGGTVFHDSDRSGANGGTLQGAEARLNGVTVRLTGSDSYGNLVDSTVVTDASGNYSFANLAPSDAAGYRISQTQPAAYVNSPALVPTTGPEAPSLSFVAGGAYQRGGDNGNSLYSGIVVTTNQAGVRYHFPELSVRTLSGRIYLDNNLDNSYTAAGDADIAGATVILRLASDASEVSRTSSDASGQYQFSDLNPLVSYVLEQPLPSANGAVKYLNSAQAVNPGLVNGVACAGCSAAANTPVADTDRILAIDLLSGNGTAFNFGEHLDAINGIYGLVYVDRDRNHQLDGSDTSRIAGVSISLWPAGTVCTVPMAGSPLATVTTNVSGAYVFSPLVVGQSYVLCQSQPVTYGNGNALGIPASNQINVNNLPAGGRGQQNFGEFAARLTGAVYYDPNNDGEKQATEVGIENVTVRLTGNDAAGQVVDLSATSIADGSFEFVDLPAADTTGYRLTEGTVPAPYSDGKDKPGTHNGVVLGAVAVNDQFAAIRLPAGESALNYWFAERRIAAVSGMVYIDENADHQRANAETTGISQVVLTLVAGSDCSAAALFTTQSDSQGLYQFTELDIDGSYSICQSQPAGYGNGNALGQPGSNQISILRLPASGLVDRDFGELVGGIGGVVFFDANNNGVQDKHEPGIADVAISLSGAASAGMQTDADGRFLFSGLLAGNYSLTQQSKQPQISWQGQLLDTINGITTAGSGGGSASSVNTVPSLIRNISLPEGGAALHNLFAEVAAVAVSGRVFTDDNNDGVQQANEKGIAGNRIELSGNNDLGESTALFADTDALGDFSFAALRPGTYTLTQPQQPDNTYNGIVTAGSAGGTVTAVVQTPSQISTVVLSTPGAASVDNLFAEVPLHSSIAGRVWLDLDNDGVIAGHENGIANVTIILSGTDVSGQAVSRSQPTDAQGRYLFSNLLPGTYHVTEPVQPENTSNGLTVVGEVVARNSSNLGSRKIGEATIVTELPSRISNIELGAAEDGIHYNFGEVIDTPDLVVTKAAVAPHFSPNSKVAYLISVRNKGNKNSSGVVTVSDRLPAGLTLAALPKGQNWQCNGAVGDSRFSCQSSDVIDANTTSAATIHVPVYVAASVPSGQLVHNAVLVEGGGEPVETAPTAGERASFETAVQQLPQCSSTIQFNACQLPVPIKQGAALSGSVWYDSGDAAQLRDAGDTPFANWLVEVVDPLSLMVIASQRTNHDGRYRFTDLIPGQVYLVQFREPDQQTLWSYPVNGETVPGAPAPCAVAQAQANDSMSSCQLTVHNRTVLQVVLASGRELPEQSLPVDPGGVVYDAIARTAVAGAVVTLTPVGSCAGFDPASQMLNTQSGYQIAGQQISQTVGRDGLYQFLFGPTAPASCQFSLSVTPPDSHSFVSSLITPQDGMLMPAGTAGSRYAVQPQLQAPAAPVGEGTRYFLKLTAGSAHSQIVHNHLPLDPKQLPGLSIVKTGDRQIVEIGDLLLYHINISSSGTLNQVNVLDTLPAGFSYVAGTAKLNGQPLADPVGAVGPQLNFAIGKIQAGQNQQLSYRVRVGVGSAQGDGINRAQAYGCSFNGGCISTESWQAKAGALASNQAAYRVRVSGGVFASEACVLGKVYVDCDRNSLQDAEEPGIPGVRLYFSNGTWLVSDSEGKYSYCGLEPRSATVKVDSSTLPKGAVLTTSSNRNLGDANSLWLDLKNGELHRADFIEGSCSNRVLEQIKARRTQGEVTAPESEQRHSALQFDSKAPAAPQQATDSANQQPVVAPRAANQLNKEGR